jgi:hypothetical protein
MKAKIKNIIMMPVGTKNLLPLLLTVAIAFTACSKNSETPEPETEPQEMRAIEISQSACTFTSKAIETFSISIGGTDKWEVRNEAAWVIAEKQPDNTLRVTTIPSRSLLKRTATVTIVAANAAQGEASFTVTQDPGKPVGYVRILPGNIALRHCSENGQWATGQFGPAVRVVDISKLAEDENYLGTQVSMEKGVHSIDNNGTPHYGGCSADGTIYSEYDTRTAENPDTGQEWWPAHYTPYIMRNNRRIDLAYPGTYTTSNIVVEGYEPRHYYQGCIPDKMSADGKYIYGRLMNVNNGWFACKWTRVGTTNEYTFKELGLNSDGDLNKWDTLYTDFEGKKYMSVEPVNFLCPQNVSGLSMNGKYACGHYGESLSGGGQLFRYDMDADKLELLTGNGIALHITDDGTLFDSSNKVWKVGSNTPGTLRSWLVETYGENVAGQVYPSCVMGSVSADKSTTILFDLNYQIDKDNSAAATYIITVEP